MEQRFCGNCGLELREGSVFCSSCGISLESPVYTKNSKPIGIFDYYKLALSQYTVFSGRSSRNEYLFFILANMIIGFLGSFILLLIATIITLITDNPEIGAKVFLWIYMGYVLYILLPNIALTVRRLHDRGKSGSWLFISLVPIVGPIYLFVQFLSKGSPEANKYGEPIEEIVS